jgi:RNA polymerase sigma factor (sigma-70 family)
MEASTAPRTAVLPASRASGLRSQRLLRLASDERLVALVRAGNKAAFETLYDRHHRALLSFCRHMLADREESEDAVQHTFIAAYNDLVGSDKEIQLRAWLYAIARNRCLSMLRSRREQPTGEDFDVPTEGLADEVERRSDLQQLLGDMRELPEEQRAALVLAEIGALSHDEIAEVVGVPKAKVKALVFQARSSLIASRDARDMSCQTVREELSTARGGVLRRGPLRRHLAGCDGCREFAGHVKHQRAALAIVLPVVPTLGLKHGVLSTVIGAGAAGGGGAAGIAAAGGGVAFIGSKGLAAKLVLGAAVAASGAAGTAAVVQQVDTGSVGSLTRTHNASSSPAGFQTAAGRKATVKATGKRSAGALGAALASASSPAAAGASQRGASLPSASHPGTRHASTRQAASRRAAHRPGHGPSRHSSHAAAPGGTSGSPLAPGAVVAPNTSASAPSVGFHGHHGHHKHHRKHHKHHARHLRHRGNVRHRGREHAPGLVLPKPHRVHVKHRHVKPRVPRGRGRGRRGSG